MFRVFLVSFFLSELGESMAMSGIYGLRNSLSESNSSLSNSSINGSCIGTFAGTTPTGSSPDDSSLQLSASMTSNPFSQLTSVSLSSSGSLNTPIKNFDNLQVSCLLMIFLFLAVLTHTNLVTLWDSMRNTKCHLLFVPIRFTLKVSW